MWQNEQFSVLTMPHLHKLKTAFNLSVFQRLFRFYHRQKAEVSSFKMIPPPTAPSMREIQNLNGQKVVLSLYCCNAMIILLTLLTLNGGLTGQHWKFWILAYFVTDLTICDPVQQKGHLVSKVYSEIMSKIVCKI